MKNENQQKTEGKVCQFIIEDCRKLELHSLGAGEGLIACQRNTIC